MKALVHQRPTISELLKWEKDKLVNPRTLRNIKENGNTYNFYQKEYDKHFPKIKDTSLNLLNCIDDKDPISLNIFWKLENDNKKIIYTDLNNLILYKDTNGLIRCFEKESLSYMKAYKINKHPVTNEEIPTFIFNKIEEKNLDIERLTKSVNDKALEIFQKFSNISIFIDSEWFINLSKAKLLKFNFEIREFYINNFTDEQKKEISDKIIFEKTQHDLETLEKDDVINYLLIQMDVLLEIKKEELKYMSNYILVGALGIVIPEIKELYPDFSFSFN